MAFSGHKRDRTVYNDRFDAMHEGELTAESMMLWCTNGDDGFGYPFVDPDRYDEWREWSFTVTEDELRDWVRANATD